MTKMMKVTRIVKTLVLMVATEGAATQQTEVLPVATMAWLTRSRWARMTVRVVWLGPPQSKPVALVRSVVASAQSDVRLCSAEFPRELLLAVRSAGRMVTSSVRTEDRPKFWEREMMLILIVFSSLRSD